MSFLSELTEAFDERGCSGFTIWLTNDGWLQVNLRRKDNISWDCKSFPDLKSAAEHIESFNAFEARRGTNKPRVPADREAEARRQKMLARRRRDDDLA